MARAKFATTPEALEAIFREAIPMFSQSGFSGVSIRHVANAVGVSIATIYHHFPDKQDLYLRCIESSYANKAKSLAEVLELGGDKEERLERFVLRFTHLMSEDSDFRRLFQRELLDADEYRLNVLAKDVFYTQFKAIVELAEFLAPGEDAHMMAVSMTGLVLFHLETTPIRRYLPGGEDEHNDPAVIAKHVTTILLNGMIK